MSGTLTGASALPATIADVERIEPYFVPNGPSGHAVKTLAYVVKVAGVPFYSTFQLGLITTARRSKRDVLDDVADRSSQAIRDLLWYVNDFVFFGCGGPYHDFPGDPTDRSVSVVCRGCGARKPENMIYDSREVARAFLSEHVDPAITKTLRPA